MGLSLGQTLKGGSKKWPPLSGIDPLKSCRDTYVGLPVHLQGYTLAVYPHKAVCSLTFVKYNGLINCEVQLSTCLQWKAIAALTNPSAPPPFNDKDVITGLKCPGCRLLLIPPRQNH